VSSSDTLDPAPHGHGEAHEHGRRRGYWLATLGAILLTVLPFWLVMTGAIRNAAITAFLIFAMAFAQIIVHVVYFLHLDARSEGGWNLLAFLFTAVIVVLTIGGSVWVMLHLNANMMPMPGNMAGTMR
jgi:cytochrome o ubiquinol oxidase operon protein cyoD